MNLTDKAPKPQDEIKYLQELTVDVVKEPGEDPYNDLTPASLAWEKSQPSGDPPLLVLWGDEE